MAYDLVESGGEDAGFRNLGVVDVAEEAEAAEHRAEHKQDDFESELLAFEEGFLAVEPDQRKYETDDCTG